ncbi:phosphatidylinositol kinase [Emticicia aquatilis]|uniref:Phosphatidylinositol kinase n=1 Tax=Emticicia aquatilis TaxID=1537369 RepID=A0A916Z790_9BACT|nr:HipA N-terminal domain-containing protein [Emticicia aquatilis]GGD79887.1 phosphatidylinositol kinase [Emticicia aquatilis]
MKAEVYYNQILAGYLEKSDNRYLFEYTANYLNSALPAISFSFPKQAKVFESSSLFPFFSGLLSEGINKEIQCKAFQIDEKDEFTRLLKTAKNDTIGAITVKEI